MFTRLVPQARRHFARVDPVMARLAKAPLRPNVGKDQDPFAALVRAIAHQQLSLKAGTTIHHRLVDVCGQVTPAAILALDEMELRNAGLSRAKVASIIDLAARAESLSFAALKELPDDEVVRRLTVVRGIGVWTAKMHLIFHMERPDVSCPEDLGLRIAAAQAYKIDVETAGAFLTARAPRWSPYNSLAALWLWGSRQAPL